MASFHLDSVLFKYKQEMIKVQRFPPIIMISKYKNASGCVLAGKTTIIRLYFEVTTSLRGKKL